MAHRNTPVPGVHEYYPLNEPAIGTHLSGPKPHLFQPLHIKGVTFKNRIFVAPMCQYSSSDGHVTDWHLVHIGTLAARGVGAICMEATSVVPEGRISPEDAGLWKDSHIAPFKRVVDFSHAQGTKIGIQLAHAGRKASTYAPWVRPKAADAGASWVAQEDEGGWPTNVYGPSATPYAESFPHPKVMTEEDMKHVEDAFAAAAERCKAIGFDFIEIHAAHGYLIHEFVSPLSNTRTDQYGGPLENRLRFPTQILQRVREVWADKPLFVRISATDWAEGPEKSEDGAWLQWGVEQCNIWLAKMLSLGVVDLLDCSSGGNWQKQTVKFFSDAHGFQVPLSEAIKQANPSLVVGAVGTITDPELAESYLKAGKADVIFLARELLRNPHWALSAAKTLGCKVKPANQYEWGLW
ncbi:putative NADPH dehydrogenase C23G7.10c [Mycena venus]|uniref:Putative NADPH dehydrogenase C23G7.10c n=1 Tax=Mycena venus TaxID=2733690 RepID=A0A8H7CVC3_9AGAR|nr:putative NADPH dehydrogenase C23G7.10c [Mycena venus]